MASVGLSEKDTYYPWFPVAQSLPSHHFTIKFYSNSLLQLAWG